MSGNKTIEEMFATRDKEYEAHFERLKDYLKPTLEGLETLFKLTDERQEGTFTWEMFEINTEAEEILIAGAVKYKPGDVIILGNQPVEITEAAAPMLERIFRFVVPIQLADKQCSVETIKYMEDVMQENETDAAQAEQIQSGAHLVDLEAGGGVGAPEFDTDELTDEQKEALFLSTGIKS